MFKLQQEDIYRFQAKGWYNLALSWRLFWLLCVIRQHGDKMEAERTMRRLLREGLWLSFGLIFFKHFGTVSSSGIRC